MMLFCAAVAFVIISIVGYICYICNDQHKYWERKGIKYIKPTMFIGNMDIFRRKSMAEFGMDLYKNFPAERYVGTYLFLQPGLIIKDADLIKEITIKHFEHFTDHATYVPPEVDPLWNRNLFASKGEKWHKLRSTLSPAFTSNKMKIMFGLIDECAKNFVGYFKEQDSETLELELKDTFTRFTNDVIATSAFGLKCDSLRDKTNEFFILGQKITDFSGMKILKFFFSGLSPTLSKLFGVRIISKPLGHYFSNIILEAVKTRKEKGIVRPDMIHLLMTAKNDEKTEIGDFNTNLPIKSKTEVTPDDIVSQAFLFFLAGFDSVSNAMTFIFYEIAINPDIQERLRKEIQSVQETLTYEDLLGLKYLDMVVSEGLRKWPIAITSDRQVTKPFTIEPVRPGEKPLHLDKGVAIAMLLFGIHRDPKFYSDPERFDPERFSDQNKHKIIPGTYIPFGSGPRHCIGNRFALLEIKMIIFYLLRDFEIVPVKRTKIPMELDPKQTVACKGGMWLGFKKLNKQFVH